VNAATIHSQSDDAFDLRSIVTKLWARRWWIVVSVVVFTGAFAAVAFLMTPVYRATTVLVPASSNSSNLAGLTSALGQLGGLASLAGISLNSGEAAQTEEALAVLRSREFTEGFIRDQQLMPVLFAGKWDAAKGQWVGPKEKWPTPAQGFKFFDRKVRTITQDRKTGLIMVNVEWRDPKLAADWANGLIVRLNAEMRSRAITKTNASVGYLREELGATSEIDTRQAINRLMEAQINQRMLANVTKEYALRVVDTALPPDPRDFVKPKRLLLLALGPTLGGMFAVLVILLADAWMRGARRVA
jgi:uncharacterized protein involved in exopolysaccharide biosynthesis